MFEVHIGDAEADGFGDPESAAVHESYRELVLRRDTFEETFNFLHGEHEREFPRLFGPLDFVDVKIRLI
jgi:hypothetical protein